MTNIQNNSENSWPHKSFEKKHNWKSGPCKSLGKKNINEPEDNSENTSPCQSFGKNAHKNSGYQQNYFSKKKKM